MPTIVTVNNDNGIELADIDRGHVEVSSVMSEVTCRICFETVAPDDAARFACDCKGVSCHDACARRWFTSRGDDTCEICLKRTNILQDELPEEGTSRCRRSWLVRKLCCCLSDGDEEDEASMSLFDLFVCAFVTCAILFVAFFSILEFDALRSITMAYAMAVAIILGCAQFLVPLRRFGFGRRQQCECAYMFVAMMIVTHQLAFALNLSRVGNQQLRNLVAQRLTFALCVSTVLVPQVVLLLAFVLHASNRAINELRYT